MRRKDRQISREEIEEILENGEYGILSTVGSDGKPYSVPMNYSWKDGRIHLHCAAKVGKKLENLSYSPEVCFVVVGRTRVIPEEFGTLYESVIVTGRVGSSPDKRKSLESLVEKYSSGYEQEGRRMIDSLLEKTDAYIIIPESITGKARKK